MKVKFEIMIKKTVTNVLLLSIAFAIIFGIVLYSIASYLMIVGLHRRYSIALGTCISMIITMTAFKLSGIKMRTYRKVKKKPVMMMTTTTLLIALLFLTPIVKAGVARVFGNLVEVYGELGMEELEPYPLERIILWALIVIVVIAVIILVAFLKIRKTRR